MKIALLGATGMLGHHTALALAARGHDLVVIHRPGSRLDRIADLRFEARPGDAEDSTGTLATSLAGVDVLVHAAAWYPPAPQPPGVDEHRAEQQMRAVLTAAKTASCRLVYVGGAIALAPHPRGEPADETSVYVGTPASRNGYLRAKWRMDTMAMAAASSGQHVSIAIPAMTFGEFDYGPTTGKLILGIANGSFPKYLPGKRNVIHGGDAGIGIALVAERGRSGERYLLTGENIAMDDLTARIARHAGVPAPKPAPLAVARLLAKWNSWRYLRFGGAVPALDETALAIITAGQFLDGRKAEAELGFKATVSIDDAIARTIRWFRSVGMLG